MHLNSGILHIYCQRLLYCEFMMNAYSIVIGTIVCYIMPIANLLVSVLVIHTYVR